MTDQERRIQSRHWIDRLHAAARRIDRNVAFMEVCGTHTVSAFRCGLRSLMAPNVSLLSGPGCPVCVTSQSDIDQIVELAARKDVTLCTYGDMMRVTGSGGASLERARGDGADVRVIYSTMDALRFATREPQRQVVLAAVGFETTAPATAAAVVEANKQGLTNFSVLMSHKRIVPAMIALLDSGRVNVDGFLCPGHVSVIIGAATFRKIVLNYHLPCVVGGFEDVQIAQALAVLTELVADGTPQLHNQYPLAVEMAGNRRALNVMRAAFVPSDAQWRGLGVIRRSGFALRARLRKFDARNRFGLQPRDVPEPVGCRCGDVITGRCTPGECRLFAKACTPIDPVGPCMVSSEGTCQAWFRYGRGGRLVANGSQEVLS
jgi:hydrogenase expression/formation protein HypD